MSFTIHSFFSNYIFHPLSLPTQKERSIALVASLVCGIFSLGLIHMTCAIRNYFENRKVENQTQYAPSSKPLKEFRKSFSHSIETKPPPENISELINNLTSPASNALEWWFEISKDLTDPERKNLGLSNELLLNVWKNRTDPTSGMTGMGINALLDAYSSRDIACIRPENGTYLGKNETPKIVYLPIHQMNQSTENVKIYVKTSLAKELTANPDHRPEKIFIPMQWSKDQKDHFVLLIVEQNNNHPEITMINTNGDAVTLFRDYEEAALSGGNEIYPGSTPLRNTKRLFTTAFSCGHDIIDIARHFSTVSSVQEEIKKKQLTCKTNKEDLQQRLDHATQLAKFYNRYLH